MPKQTKWGIGAVASVVAVVLGVATLLGLPKCNDIETRSEAKAEHEKIYKRIDLLEKDIKGDTGEILRILKEGQ